MFENNRLQLQNEASCKCRQDLELQLQQSLHSATLQITLTFSEAHSPLVAKTRVLRCKERRHNSVLIKFRVAKLEVPLGPLNVSPSFYSWGNKTPRLSNCPKVIQPINGRAQMGIHRPQLGAWRSKPSGKTDVNACVCLWQLGLSDIHGNHSPRCLYHTATPL
jgi:hypothetical protein